MSEKKKEARKIKVNDITPELTGEELQERVNFLVRGLLEFIDKRDKTA